MYSRHPKLVRIWQRLDLWSITLEGELVWWCSDDVRLRKRKLDHEIRFPKWIWRPYCWIYEHEPYGYKHRRGCITCGKRMP